MAGKHGFARGCRLGFDHLGPSGGDVYDETYSAMFEPSVLNPMTGLLADLARGGPALEFAVGAGRVAFPLSARGIAIHGLVLSRHMAERLAAKPGAEAVLVIWPGSADAPPGAAAHQLRFHFRFSWRVSCRRGRGSSSARSVSARQGAGVELCFTPTNASWANPIEAQFGPLRTFAMGGSDHPNHTVLARRLQAYLRWRNANARHPDILAAQRRERARIRSERQQRWGRPKPKSQAA